MTVCVCVCARVCVYVCVCNPCNLIYLRPHLSAISATNKFAPMYIYVHGCVCGRVCMYVYGGPYGSLLGCPVHVHVCVYYATLCVYASAGLVLSQDTPQTHVFVYVYAICMYVCESVSMHVLHGLTKLSVCVCVCVCDCVCVYACTSSVLTRSDFKICDCDGSGGAVLPNSSRGRLIVVLTRRSRW